MATTNVRYRADFYSMDDIRWRIDIHDTEYSDSANEFFIGIDSMDGFTLNYQNNNNERFSPVIASKCSISAVSNDAAFETFISDITGAHEERFSVVIYKYSGGSFNIYWAGHILNDLVKKEDMSYPYAFIITATDALGRLKDIDYAASSTVNYSGRDTFIEHLIKILGKTNLMTFWEADHEYLKTAIDWYEDDMFAGSPAYTLDPLNVTNLDHDAFITQDQSGDENPMNCFDVLIQLCIRWNARICLSDGKYHFMQVNNHENSTFSTRSYKKDGTLYGTIENDDFKVLAANYDREGFYEYFPPLQRVKVKYKYKQATNLGNLLPADFELETEYNLGDIPGGTTEQLRYNGLLQEDFDFTTVPTGAVFKSVWLVKLQVGSYYYTNKNGYGEWTQISTDRYTFITSSHHIAGSTHPSPIEFAMYFLTQSIPESGTGYFKCYFSKYIDKMGNTVTLHQNAVVVNTALDFRLLLFYTTLIIQEGEVLFEAKSTTDGTTLVDSTVIINLPDMLTGDGPKLYSAGRLKIKNTGATWENSDAWAVAGSGAAIDINKLLCKEVLSGQRTAIPIYNGKIIGEVDAVSVLVLNSDYYIFLGGSYNAWENTWNGQWFKIDINRTHISIPSAKIPPPDDPHQVFSPGLPGFNTTKIVKQEQDLFNSIKNEGLTVVSSNVSTGAVTSIPITAIGVAVLKKGDKITLIESYDYTKHELIMDADQSASDTTLTIVSHSFTSAIQAGAIITQIKKQIKQNILLPPAFAIKGNKAVKTANYNLVTGDSVVYGDPFSASFNIRLPKYSDTDDYVFYIINIDNVNSLRVTREDISDKINEAASDLTIAANTAIMIHNSGIASIGWATIIKTTRK